QNGWVDRTQLLAIRGRSRSAQLAMASRKGVEVFGCPSGGCLLTDPAIARRLKDTFCFIPDCDLRDATLVTFGRHFRLHPGLKVILGRNQTENDRLQKIGAEWPRLEIAEIPGPAMLLRGKMRDEDRQPLGHLLKRYARKAGADTVTIQYTSGERREQWNVTREATNEEVNRCRI
ncbi:MAG: hypothetical protein Q7J98_05815, partial [Kiritimatiellia bacterium]|nr:hypothetical protein [Kiritimatiellia bacterium]